MAAINYLLYEAPMGYGVFQIEHQPDSIGLRQKEAQETIADLSKFGKMVKLVNFTPFEYDFPQFRELSVQCWRLWWW